MKLRTLSLALLCLTMALVSASAQVLYEDGPLNGTTDAWTINFGYVVSNSFTLTNNATMGGFDIYTWEFPGDKTLSIDWAVTSDEFGGTLYGEGTATVTDQFISANQYGYNVEKVTASNLNLDLAAGTYWLNLQNAVTEQGNPLYWDENSGIGCHSQGCPSEVSENDVGTIPPESFDVTGTYGGQVPEPSSILLIGSGILGAVAFLRRRF